MLSGLCDDDDDDDDDDDVNPFLLIGARCRSVVRAFAHGAMGRPVDPSWWTIARSSQCSTTGITKAVVCAILSVGWCITLYL